MKKHFLFALALLSASVLSAQTIAIDGQSTDWAEVPMLTEPGTTPMVKMVVEQAGISLPEGIAYAVLVEGEHEQILANYPVIYTDADNDATTGTSPWFCPAMGYDYEMATWSANSLFAQSTTGNIREVAISKAAFSGVAFSGTVSAWLTFDWGKLYIPTDPITEGYKWPEATYHPLYVAPYTYQDLNGTHTAASAYATHQALKAGDALNMKNAGSANDTLLWASWAVELKQAGEYTVSANLSSTNGASVDLALVDPQTNTVVATLRSEDMWQPEGDKELGTWDISQLTAGKYVLKFSNHVAWSEMVLNSISLSYVEPEKPSEPSALNEMKTGSRASKLMKDGRLLIERDGRTYNALGQQL